LTGEAEIFELPGGGRALFTARAHGNLSSVTGEGAASAAGARERLASTIGVRRLVRGRQVHGTAVGRIAADGVRHPDRVDVLAERDGEPQPGFQADGHALAARQLGALVLAADCLPVALGADGAVAALHAGWRGLGAGVLEEGVRALREVGGSGPIRAVVGPCAGGCCYEVGEEIHVAFGRRHGDGRLIDLRAIAEERLVVAGVVEVGHLRACTICDERFFSHRREGGRAGRQAGVAWLV
jgi:polyphenol oxidase